MAFLLSTSLYRSRPTHQMSMGPEHSSYNTQCGDSGFPYSVHTTSRDGATASMVRAVNSGRRMRPLPRSGECIPSGPEYSFGQRCTDHRLHCRALAILNKRWPWPLAMTRCDLLVYIHYIVLGRHIRCLLAINTKLQSQQREVCDRLAQYMRPARTAPQHQGFPQQNSGSFRALLQEINLGGARYWNEPER
jgi:hypothetical protein